MRDKRWLLQEHCDKLCCQNVCRVCVLSTAHRMIDGEMYYSLSKNNRRIRRYKHTIKSMMRT